MHCMSRGLRGWGRFDATVVVPINLNLTTNQDEQGLVAMSVQVLFEDDLLRGRDFTQFKKQANEAMLLYDYLNSEISIGEFAESMGLHIIDAREWLHRRGVATSRKIRDPQLADSVLKDHNRFQRLIESS